MLDISLVILSSSTFWADEIQYWVLSYIAVRHFPQAHLQVLQNEFLRMGLQRLDTCGVTSQPLT
jgi:hypothetical protein